METLGEFFSADLLTTFVVFIVLLAGFAYVFAGKKIIAVLSGLFSIILSVFSSPFIYFKKATVGLDNENAKVKAQAGQARYYLLNKLILVFQALLVILSVAVFAIGFVSAWNQLFPSKALRETIGATEEELKKLKSELQQAEPVVGQMQTVWTTRRDSLVKAYNAERPRKADMLSARNTELAASPIAGSDSAQLVLSDIKSYHAQNDYLTEPSQFEPVFTEITDFIERQGLSPDIKNLVIGYNNNWYTQMLSRFETTALSENQLRFVTYPEYHSRQVRLDVLRETIPVKERDIEQLRSEEKFNVEAFVVYFLITIVLFMLFVWFMGLLIESFRLSVDIATDMKSIREHFEKH